MANPMQDALKLAVEPYQKRLGELSAELEKIDAPIKSKVEAKQAELQAKLSADLKAYGDSLLTPEMAKRRSTIVSDKEATEAAFKPLRDLWLKMTVRGRNRGARPGEVDAKTGFMVKALASAPVYDKGVYTFVFADGKRLDLADGIFHADQAKGKVSGGSEAYRLLTEAGFNDGQARSFIDKHRTVLNLKG